MMRAFKSLNVFRGRLNVVVIQRIDVSRLPFRVEHKMLFHQSSRALQDDVDLKNFDPSKVVVTSSSKSAAPSPLDREKELYALKRSLSAQYSAGNYDLALKIAVELQEKSEQLFGKKNSVYASCVNNVALMLKMLGSYDSAMTKYVEALHIYEEVDGKRSASYASSLSNLGALYRLQAAEATGMAKHNHLLRAEEAFSDALELRKEILGHHHRDTISSEILLAGLRRAQGKLSEALESLQALLETCIIRFSNEDILVATVSNNIALALKENKEYEKAIKHYKVASAIRNKTLGENHPDSIVVYHNMAECFHAMGREADALALQERILSFVDPSEMEKLQQQQQQAAVAQENQQQPQQSSTAPPTAPHPHAHLNINNNPEMFSSKPPSVKKAESLYKPVSRKRR